MNHPITQMNGVSVEEKKRLLADLLQRQALEPRKFPLSFAQERLWFLTALDPEDPSYNVPVAFRLTGPLNVAALEKSIAAIIARHETLRTTFAVVDGEPFQFVSAKETSTLELIDLSGATHPESECKELLAIRAKQRFDLARERPLRALLVRLGADEYLLMLTMHHIVSDAWSVGVLIRELSSFYTSFVSGGGTSLPELPIQYRDFAEWQRKWLEGESLKQQVAYWTSQLAGAAKLDLPADHARPALRTFRGAHLGFSLGT